MYNEYINDFIEIVERERNKRKEATTAEVIKTMVQNGYMPFFKIKRVVVKDYFINQRRLGWGVNDSIKDAAVAFGVSEGYVRNIIYRDKEIK